ncbi:hypothetical protein MN116_008737 [Schistosoma mekongi]|uniref:Uncharacterized protein n=1 Tax=Schistosoma mekongi TaxID=38744 RepID=A0AAE2D1D9_SCHME|nr:hypothetical protein MN116_008737 [Schistosoma mekongi]
MEYSEDTPNNEFLLKMHELLLRFGPMDKRFGIRARVSHCIPVTISLLRTQVALLNSSMRNHCTVTHSISPITEFYKKHLKNLFNFHLYSLFNQNTIKQDIMLNIHSTIPTISSMIHHNLIIILHMICLYISNGGKTNSYLLGRNGVIKLIILLITLLSGLHVYKTYSSDINSRLSSSSSSSSMKTTDVVNPLKITKILMNDNINSVDNNSQLLLSSSTLTMKMNKNSLHSNKSCINKLSNVHDNKSTIISNDSIGSSSSSGSRTTSSSSSSPVITVITGLTLATIYLQRLYHEEAKKVSFHNNNNNKSTNMIYTTDLYNSAISLITTKPTLIAIGVKYNSNLLCLLVNTLNSLIKYKNNARRANNHGAVPLLLDLFLDIHRCDLHWHWIDLQKNLLNCLKQLTTISSGRKALIKSEGFHSLFAVCAGYIGPDPIQQTKYTLLQMISKHTNLNTNLLYHQELLLNSPVSQHNRSHSVTTTTTTRTEMTTSIDTVNITPLTLSNKKLHSKNVNIISNEISSLTSPNCNTSVCITSNNETISNLHEICRPATKLSPSTVFHKINHREVNTLLNNNLHITDSNQSINIYKHHKYSDPINILIQAFVLLRRCCPRCYLPVDNVEGILGYRLPKGV